MQNNKHKYSTIALGVIILMAIIITITGAITSDEVDELCSTNDKILKRLAGNWTCADDEVGTGGTTYNITNNITNNITTTNNITITNNMTIANQSIQCGGGANQYYYNLTWINGVQSGTCADDTDTDTNDTGLYYTKAESNTNNASIWNVLNLKGNSNLTIAEVDDALGNATAIQLNLVAQNTTNYATFWKLTDGQTNNNSVYTSINAKHTPGACAAGQFVNQTTTSGVLCQTPAGGSADGTGGWFNTTTGTQTTLAGQVNNTLTVYNLTIVNLTQASCDVKATTSGQVYCGTDAIGGGSTDYTYSLNITPAMVNTTSTTSYSSIPGIAIRIPASKTAMVECDILGATNITTVGFQLQFNWTRGSTAVNLSHFGFMPGGTTASLTAFTYVTTTVNGVLSFNMSSTQAGTTTAGQPVRHSYKATVQTPAIYDANMTAWFKAEATGTASLIAGSRCEVKYK